MGRNLGSIAADLHGDSVTAANVKLKLKYFPVPADETWRVDMLKELLEVRSGLAVLPNLEPDDISEMIAILCTT